MPMRRFIAQKIMKHVTRTKKKQSSYYEICVDRLTQLPYDDLVILLQVIVNDEEMLEDKLFEL
jgi:hypothetical protein